MAAEQDPLPMPPVFDLNVDGAWSPTALARGPFEGVQGGAAAALLAVSIQDQCADFIASVTTHFLRPVPLSLLRVAVRPLRIGRRVSVIDAELSTADGLVAVQRATAIAARPQESLPTPPRLPVDPETLPARYLTAPRPGPWFLDSMDVRVAPDGVAWFRQQTPLFRQMTPLCRVLAAADWAHGLTPPMGCDARPQVGIPNPDLTVHLFRSPRGDWIGVEAACAWSSDAVGIGWGALYDVEGLIGRVAMSVAVTLLEEAVG